MNNNNSVTVNTPENQGVQFSNVNIRRGLIGSEDEEDAHTMQTPSKSKKGKSKDDKVVTMQNWKSS